MISITIKLLSTLDNKCQQESLNIISASPSIDKEVLCTDLVDQVSKQYLEQIENLRDQIRVLQETLRRGKVEKQMGSSSRMSVSCLEELHYSDKILRTDAIKGQSYPTERHNPIFTYFNLWSQYIVSPGLTGKVMDKVNGLQRVS